MAEALARVKSPTVLCFLLLGIAHVYFLNVYPRFIHPNVASRVYMTLAIVDHGSMQIDRYISEQYIGDAAEYEGHYYSDKPPGLSIWLLPFAWLVRLFVPADRPVQEVLYWLRVLGLSLPVLWFWHLAREHFTELIGDARSALALVVAGALGTNFFIYATQLFGHVAAACTLFGAYLLLRRLAEGELRPSGALGLGTLLGLTFVSDYIVLIAVASLGLYALYLCRGDARRASMLALGAAVPLSLWLWMNAVCFGHPLTVGFHLSIGTEFRDGYQSGFMGIHPPDLGSLALMWLEPARGMFFLSPFLALSLPGFYLMLRHPAHRRDAGLALTVIGSLVLFASTTLDWRGGWAIGVRYLVPAVPFLLVGICGLFRDPGIRERVAPYFTALAAVGLCLVGASAASWPHFPPPRRDPRVQHALPFAVSSVVGLSVADLVGAHLTAAPFAMLLCVAVVVLVLLLGRTARARARMGLATALIGASLLGAAFAASPVPVAPEQHELRQVVHFMGYGP